MDIIVYLNKSSFNEVGRAKSLIEERLKENEKGITNKYNLRIMIFWCFQNFSEPPHFVGMEWKPQETDHETHSFLVANKELAPTFSHSHFKYPPVTQDCHLLKKKKVNYFCLLLATNRGSGL